MNARAAVALAAALCIAPVLLGECSETLDPVLLRELPLKVLRRAHGVAWINGGTVAVGSDRGIFAYGLADESLRRLIGSDAVPDGLPEVEDIGIGGTTLVAFNQDYSDLAVDLRTNGITAARHAPAMQILDIAVTGDTLVVLGYPAILHREMNGALWAGKVGAKWDTFRLLHQVPEEATKILRSAIAPFGGAVTVLADGSIAMITPAEAGIRRFRADGTELPTLGRELTDLVVPRMPEVRNVYSRDIVGRYVQLFNRQPLADDLVSTAAGVAIVVRRAGPSAVGWELWFPREDGSPARRIRLGGIEDPSNIAGHLRCSGRNRRIACLFPKVTAVFKPDQPYLAIFDLDRVKRSGTCGN